MSQLPPLEQSARKAVVTYYDPYGVWDSVKPELDGHLPLRNLHWASTNRPVRTISTLQISFAPFREIDDPPTSPPMSSLSDKPYVNIILVKCDDNDAYRASVRKTVRDWLTIAQVRRNQEWLIVYVMPVSGTGSDRSRFSIRKSVFDKIRSDFNSSKRDRCAQIRFPEGNKGAPKGATTADAELSEAWPDLIQKLKDSVLTAFEARVSQYEDDIEKVKAQQNIPGWNYCTYFTLREGLAISFEGFGLLNDALEEYDGLELVFAELLQDKQLTWFDRIGSATKGEDVNSILNFYHDSHYRSQILQNTISIFDFRRYLFSRQAHLLQRMKLFGIVAVRGREFISSLLQTIRASGNAIAPDFVESWAFSSCMEIERAVTFDETAWGPSGDLLMLARMQLDRLNKAHWSTKHILPLSRVFELISIQDDDTSPKKFEIGNDLLRNAMSSEVQYSTLYMVKILGNWLKLN